MAFKKTTFTSIAVPGKRALDIKRENEWSYEHNYNNDQKGTFDGNDVKQGIPSGKLSLKIRINNKKDDAVILENQVDSITDEVGATVTILDGKHLREYGGCIPDTVSPSNTSDGENALAIDFLVMDKKDPQFVG